jgi:hypothetical protein
MISGEIIDGVSDGTSDSDAVVHTVAALPDSARGAPSDAQAYASVAEVSTTTDAHSSTDVHSDPRDHGAGTMDTHAEDHSPEHSHADAEEVPAEASDVTVEPEHIETHMDAAVPEADHTLDATATHAE